MYIACYVITKIFQIPLNLELEGCIVIVKRALVLLIRCSLMPNLFKVLYGLDLFLCHQN